MRQVAVFNENLNQLAQGRVHADTNSIQSFKLNDHAITCGLITCGDTKFERWKPENAQKVLVRKKAFSCNYRDKSLVVNAQKSIDKLARLQQAKFYTLGSEFTGEVVAVGSEVKDLAVGDRVIGNGNYPFSAYEQAKPGLPTNHGSKELEVFHFSKLVKVPHSMPVEVAASFPIGGQTVYSMVRRLQLVENEKVLITAATSNTSLFAISVLKRMNVRVYAVTTRQHVKQKLTALGADEVFVVQRGLNSLAEDEKILDFVQQHGLFNAVIDPFFDIYLGQVIDLIAVGGRYISCGLFNQPGIGDHQDAAPKPTFSMAYIMGNSMLKNIQIIGNCIGHTADLQRAIEDYRQGKLDVVIDSVYKDVDVADFFNRSFNHPDRFGKVVFKY